MGNAKKFVFDRKVTAAEDALVTSGSNWGVRLEDLITLGGTNVASHRAVVRDDVHTAVGIVGNGYRPVDNVTAFSFFDAICKANRDVSYTSVTIVDDGRQVRLQARVNGGIAVRKDDEVIKQINLVNSFDGSTKLTAYYTVERLICTNGLRGPRRGASTSVMHTVNVAARISEALRVFADAEEYHTHFIELCRELARKRADAALVENFLAEVQGLGTEGSKKYEEKRARIEDLFVHGRGNHGTTRWDLYNAYTEWLDHEYGKPESRLRNSLVATDSWKQRAFEYLVRD